MIRRNAAYCETKDCRAYLRKNAAYCATKNCRAFISGNGAYCRQTMKTIELPKGRNPGSLNRLTLDTLDLFPGNSLFDNFGKTVCRAGCLPRKELFEAWEVAKRVRRKFKKGRVVDLACGHGLLAYSMLLMGGMRDSALAVDRKITSCGHRIATELVKQWPKLDGAVEYRESRIQDISLMPDDIVVSVHACGGLTDEILNKAVKAGCRVAVMPCCHALKKQNAAGYDAWVPGDMAIDIERVAHLRAMGYQVNMAKISDQITPKNRLILAKP